MKWMFGRAALWVWVTILSAAVAFAAGQVQLPEGTGKPILESACTVCHEIEKHVTTKHYAKDEWEGIVQAMRDRGAELTDDEFGALTDYLAKSFGTAPADAAGGGGSNNAEVQKLVENSCTACHGLDLITSQQKDKDGWSETVQGMVAMGAQLTEAQIPVVVDYLVKTYGPAK